MSFVYLAGEHMPVHQGDRTLPDRLDPPPLTAAGEFGRILPASMAHHLPGRLRLRIPGLKRNAAGLAAVAHALRAAPEVLACETSPWTGSLLIHYRPRAADRFVSSLAEFARTQALFHLPTDFQAMTNWNRPWARRERGASRCYWRALAGNFFLWIGIAGLLLPVVPGTPFLLVGIALVGRDHPTVERARRWIQKMGEGRFR